MPYERQNLFNQAVSVIPKQNLYFIEDIIAYLPCDKTTFYRYFSVNLPEDIRECTKEQMEELVLNPSKEPCNGYNFLKELLEVNKIKTKTSIREKLHKGDKAAELLALYKLICTKEERRNLSMQAIDHTTDYEKIQPNIINLGSGLKPEDND